MMVMMSTDVIAVKIMAANMLTGYATYSYAGKSSDMILKIILLILPCLCKQYSTASEINLCPGISGCSCKRGSDAWNKTLELRCYRATDPALPMIPHENITKITIQSSTFNNVSLLREIHATRAVKIYLISNSFGNNKNVYFSWNWLPDTAQSLAIHSNGFRGFNSAGYPVSRCDMTASIPYFSSLFIKGENLSSAPSCIPNTTKFLLLDSLEDAVVETTLRNIPVDSLETLIIRNNLNQLLPEDIARLHKANHLKMLRIHNTNLAQIPNNLPSSLTALSLTGNKIKKVDPSVWTSTPVLLKLELSYNQLSMVPLSMPATLETINLGRNNIEYSDPKAFIQLKNLTHLDLSNNRLANLPKGIPTGIKTYSVHSNQISLVRGAEEYDFCIHCAYMWIDKNPWLCDVQMLRMVVWLRTRKISTALNSPLECSKHQFKGMDVGSVERLLDYTKYFMTPPNIGCMYNIDSLECENIRLEEMPHHLPPSLVKIAITGNPNLRNIPDYKLENQTELRNLNLKNNSLTHIPYGLPPQITMLDLRQNIIGDFSEKDSRALQNLTALETLYLEDNGIKVLHAWQFERLSGLKWIGLSGNLLHCDCNIMSFAVWFEEMAQSSGFKAANYPLCHTPAAYQDRDIRRLYGLFVYELQCAPLTCEWNGSTTMNCSAYNTEAQNPGNHEPNAMKKSLVSEPPDIPPSSYWTNLDLSGLNLKDSQIQYRHLNRLTTVNLSDNLLTKIPYEGLPSSVETLKLSGNLIKNIPSDAILKKYLPNLQSLDIRSSSSDIKTLNGRIKHLQQRVHHYNARVQFLQSKLQYLRSKLELEAKEPNEMTK